MVPVEELNVLLQNILIVWYWFLITCTLNSWIISKLAQTTTHANQPNCYQYTTKQQKVKFFGYPLGCCYDLWKKIR